MSKRIIPSTTKIEIYLRYTENKERAADLAIEYKVAPQTIFRIVKEINTISERWSDIRPS